MEAFNIALTEQEVGVVKQALMQTQTSVEVAYKVVGPLIQNIDAQIAKQAKKEPVKSKKKGK